MKKQAIAEFLERPSTTWFTTALIIFSVICFSIETLPGLNTKTMSFFFYAETIVVVIFTIEYLLRLYSRDKRWKFVFSFYGIVDLLAILPYYLVTALDLRSLRLLRLLRLLRIVKLTRYNKAWLRFSRAIFMAKEELAIFTFASFLMIYLAAVGIYHFEHAAQPEVFKSIFDCLWWAVATLTTVGYGDVFPITLGGRLFTFFVLMIGLGLVAVPTGIVASSLAIVRKDDQDADYLTNQVDKTKSDKQSE